MKVSALLTVVTTGAIVLSARPPVQSHVLTFAERVKAQEAIERVYYSHQIGATKPFEEAVPRELLEKKVRTYLKESVALEKLWHTPITAAALQAEMERITSNTRLPERLQEVYQALGDDPVLIAESVARPVVVDRLARSFFAFDERIHAAPRKEAEDHRRRLVSGDLDTFAEHRNRQVLDLVRREQPRRLNGKSPSVARGRTGAGPSGGRLELGPEEFERWRARAPRRPGEIGPISEERDAFVVSVALEETADGVRLAIFTIPKIPWETWWEEVTDDFDEAVITEAPAPSVRFPALPLTSVARSNASRRIIASDADMSVASPTCTPDDTWDNDIMDDLLRPRADHTAVWTGNLMIVWGGVSSRIAEPGTIPLRIPGPGRAQSTPRRRAPGTRPSGPVQLWLCGVEVVWTARN